MAVVYANIGSNLGNKKELIKQALDRIGEKFGYYCISGFVESDPWGFESTNRFLNVGVAFQTERAPEEILDALQEIEKGISKERHRNADGTYKDREIDIDIMAIDDIDYKSERLIIPHPHLENRDFFLIPFNELKIKEE